MGRQYGTPARVRGMSSDTYRRLMSAGHAYRFLILARQHARLAGAVQLIPRIQHAIKSADGAVRHASGRHARHIREDARPVTRAAVRIRPKTGGYS